MNTTEQPLTTQDPVVVPTARPVEPTSETPLEALASMCVVVVIGLFLFGFVFQNFMIPSGSMKNTLLVGDHVLVDRITLSPPTRWAPFVHYRPVQRGDIIVFRKPNPESPDLILVKRAIAVAGDHFHLEHGVLYLNGVAQREPYAIQPEDAANGGLPYNAYRDDFPRAPLPDFQITAVWREDLPSHIQNGEFVVPAGYVFAMGDNRTHSADSRYWGLVPLANIEGRPMFVYWSFRSPEVDDLDPTTSEQADALWFQLTHFFTKTRWSRTGHITR